MLHRKAGEVQVQRFADRLREKRTQNQNSGAGVDEGNLVGDYFYLEALTRLVSA